MKTSQQLIECLDCEELYVLIEKGSQYFLRSPDSRKAILYHSGMLCPGCQGMLISSSFQQMNQIAKARKDEITHLKLLQGDFQYKIDSLQKQLADVRHVSEPEQKTCLQCGKAVTQGKKGRAPDYCSNACKQKAYRQRRMNNDRETTKHTHR